MQKVKARGYKAYWGTPQVEETLLYRWVDNLHIFFTVPVASILFLRVKAYRFQVKKLLIEIGNFRLFIIGKPRQLILTSLTMRSKFYKTQVWPRCGFQLNIAYFFVTIKNMNYYVNKNNILLFVIQSYEFYYFRSKSIVLTPLPNLNPQQNYIFPLKKKHT